MPIEVIMPKVDMDMESGRILAWHAGAGDFIEKGDPLFDIETDKATMEVESPGNGTLQHTAPVGANIPIGRAVAWLYSEREKIGPPPEGASAVPERTPAEPGPDLESVPQKAAAELRSSETEPSGKLRASPLARRLARERGIDLARIKGSGPRGRIVKADVTVAPALNSEPTDAVPAGSTAAAVMKMFQGREFEEVPLDGMRRTVAALLAEAKQAVPHFYLRRRIRLDALLDLRARANRLLEGRTARLSVNDFVVKACAAALQQVPGANAVWAGDRILRIGPSDVAVAVAVEGGLFTLVLRDAHQKPLATLSAEIRDLAVRARDRRLAPHEYQGGSFAVSNLGMFGIDGFDAVINPPHSSILAVGARMRKPVVDDSGGLATAMVMDATLSVDHRVIDGALGAEFLRAITDNLENPVAMLV